MKPMENHDGQMDQLVQDYGEIRQEIGGLKSAVSGIQQILSRVEDRLARPPAQVNWVGVGALIVSLAVAAAQYGEARLGPMNGDIADLKQHINTQLRGQTSDYERFGRTQERSEIHSDEIRSALNRINILEERTSASDARSEALIEISRRVPTVAELVVGLKERIDTLDRKLADKDAKISH